MSETSESVTSTEVMEAVSGKGLLRPKTKEMTYPGHINFADVRGNYPGCAAVLFMAGMDDISKAIVTAAEAMNLFFERNKGLLVVDVKLAVNGILCLYTKVVPPEELERMERFHEKVRELMEKEDIAREEREEKEREAQEAQAKEHQRLIALGREYEKSLQQRDPGEAARGKRKKP